LDAIIKDSSIFEITILQDEVLLVDNHIECAKGVTRYTLYFILEKVN
jgi:hypothetical protein